MKTKTTISAALTIATCVASLLVYANRTEAQGGAPAAVTPSSFADKAKENRALLDQYCVACHNAKARVANLSLADADIARIAAHPEIWEKVVIKLQTGAMPPAGRPRPDTGRLNAFADFLVSDLDKAAAAHPNPGRTEAMHRLNRTEYQNAVRDLLALDIDASTLLPADPSNEIGFDNVAGSLTITPALLERYVTAAREVSKLAVARPADIATDQVQYRLPNDYEQDTRIEGAPFGTRGGTVINHFFPLDGTYTIKLDFVRAGQAAGNIAGLTDQYDVLIFVDGQKVQTSSIGQKLALVAAGGRGGRGAPANPADDAAAAPGPGRGGRGGAAAAPDDAPAAAGGGRGAAAPGGGRGVIVLPPLKLVDVTLPLKAGKHQIIATFVAKTSEAPEGAVSRPAPVNYGAGATHNKPYISTVSILGPVGEKKVGESESRKRVFVCRPAAAATESTCARRIIATLAKRAYRRAVTDADIQLLTPFYISGRKEGDFDLGIQRVVERVLASPEFLFRTEYDPPKAASGMVYKISDTELASRLSFFLWSSIPDDQLLDLAIQRKLHDPAVFEKQVRRMLADNRSSALTANFAGQWLRLRDVSVARPDLQRFPLFDENMRQSMRKQTEMFFEAVLRENRPVTDFLNANYTFLDERLAKLYGIPNVYGDYFRRVELKDGDIRGSLLGQGSILTITSYADRTSPVQRGKFVLDSLLGTPPPPPPPNVPPFKGTDEAGKAISARQVMEAHRANPACAGCHARMDPIGFSLDNFDGIGRWRTSEANTPIDASAVLVDGTKFSGPTGLRDMLMAHQDQFIRTVTEKLMTYALGRGVEYYDEPAVRSIMRSAAASGNTLTALILGVTKSVPFQMRSAQAVAPQAIASQRDDSKAAQ